MGSGRPPRRHRRPHGGAAGRRLHGQGSWLSSLLTQVASLDGKARGVGFFCKTQISRFNGWAVKKKIQIAGQISMCEKVNENPFIQW